VDWLAILSVGLLLLDCLAFALAVVVDFGPALVAVDSAFASAVAAYSVDCLSMVVAALPPSPCFLSGCQAQHTLVVYSLACLGPRG
jgi:hypothetical protein